MRDGAQDAEEERVEGIGEAVEEGKNKEMRRIVEGQKSIEGPIIVEGQCSGMLRRVEEV